jgi:hypothetical protein
MLRPLGHLQYALHLCLPYIDILWVFKYQSLGGNEDMTQLFTNNSVRILAVIIVLVMILPTIAEAQVESSQDVVIDSVTRFIIHWRPDDWNPGVSDADPATIVGWYETGARAGYQKIINDAHFQLNPANPVVDIYIWNESPGGEYGPCSSLLHPGAFQNQVLPITAGTDGKYYIYVTERDARDYITAHVSYPTFQDLYTGTVSHEFFHIVQLGYNMTGHDAEWMFEGQARFIPTYVIGGDQGEFWQNQNLVNFPPGPYNQSADQRSKYIYNSMGYFDLGTSLNYLDYLAPPEDRWRHIGYDACLYWRYVFEHFGGISVIKQIDEQYQSALPGDSLCQQVAVVNSVLGTTDIGFAHFAEANYLEFSPHDFARQSNYYQFSDRYYGNVPLNDTIDWAPGVVSYSRSGTLSGFGVVYFEIIPHGNVNSMRISFSGDPGPYVVKTFTASGANVVTTPIPLNIDNTGFVTLSGIGSADVIGLMIAKPTCTSGGSFSWTARNLEIPLPTTTSLTSSVNPSKWGQPVTFNATVTDGATGDVIFLIGARPTVSSSLDQQSPNNATYGPLSDLNIGDTNIDAQYMGDTANQPSSAPRLIQTVVKADTTIIVTSNHNPSVFGQTVTFSATVSAVAPGTGTPAGTVQFKVDGADRGSAVLLSSGSASIDISDLGVTTGTNHVIQAVYSGNANYLTSTGTLSGGQQVNQVTTSTAVTSNHNPSVFGQTVTFSATVSTVSPGTGTPAGTVQFKVDGANRGAEVTLSSGSASIDISDLGVTTGTNHVIQAIYSGNANYLTSTGTLSGGQQVNKANTATAVISSKNPSVYSQLAPTFTATVVAVAPGAGIPAGTVTFKRGTTTLGTGTLSGGSATFTPSTTALAVGTHSITAVYGGDANFIGSTSPVLTQTVNPPPKITAYVPTSGKQGAAAFKFVISGSAFQNGATVSLTKSGVPAIDATGVTVSSQKNSITCTLKIPSGAPTGSRSVTVKNPDGGTVTVSGFTVK